MTTIAVYQDYVHNTGSLLMTLQNCGVTIRHVDAGGITGGALEGASVLVMPGGADLFYCEKLNGAGNAAIRAFVEAGGGYLGICAGAYYGCSQLDWNAGEIAGGRELGFIDAVATGPVTAFIENGDITKSWYGAVVLDVPASPSFRALYAAGPLFKNLAGDTDVLARYADLAGAPAVIGRRVGRGHVVLSSPHIECTSASFASGRYRHRAASATHEARVAAELAGHDAAQLAFFKAMLTRAGGF